MWDHKLDLERVRVAIVVPLAAITRDRKNKMGRRSGCAMGPPITSSDHVLAGRGKNVGQLIYTLLFAYRRQAIFAAEGKKLLIRKLLQANEGKLVGGRCAGG